MNDGLVVTPKPSNNNAYHIFFALLLSTVGAIAASYFVHRYRGVVQFAGVLLLVTALLIYVRFIAARYSYEIATDTEGTPLFVVRQQTGKRITTLCRIALAEIVSVTPESRAERRAHKTPKDVRRYFYTPSIAPAKSVRIYAVNRYEKAEIVIEANDDYLALLRSDIEEAKAIAAASEDSE